MSESRRHKHFAEQWAERGNPKYDGLAVAARLAAEHRKLRKGGDSKFLEFVMDARKDPTLAFYRFAIEGVPYYAVINKVGDRCVTLYTQKMLRKQKGTRRIMKKWRSQEGSVGKKARSS